LRWHLEAFAKQYEERQRIAITGGWVSAALSRQKRIPRLERLLPTRVEARSKDELEEDQQDLFGEFGFDSEGKSIDITKGSTDAT
jgi:hypothetical protein